MVGDGPPALAQGGAAASVEPQYATAKTSIWWDIENCHVPRGCDPHAIAQNISSALVKMNYTGPITISAYGDTTGIPYSVQRALSSTGIALNHVPSGSKDASDKKILVDMLFWAVDNPAPANYLLISGDRDFSNAIHQLRMRRYNILLAKPMQASTALDTAANSIWLWTSLVNGGAPLPVNGGPSNGVGASQRETTQTSARDKILPSRPSYSNTDTLPLGSQSQKFSAPGRMGDSTFKLQSTPKCKNQANTTRITSSPVKLEESKETLSCHQSETISTKRFMKAPHEFFGTTAKAVAPSRSAPNLLPGNIGTHNNTSQPVPSSLNGVGASASSSVALPDIGRVSAVDHPSFFQNGPVSNCRIGEDSRLEPTVSLNPNSSFSDNVDGKYPLSSDSAEYVQGLIGVILIALNTLKVEKIVPTEANITHCIRYGDSKYRNIDVRKALKCALDQNMIVKQHLGQLELYLGKIERLWPCENPEGGNPEQYPNATWAAIQKFLSSSTGRSALIASVCRYEAALVLQKSCLTTVSVGEVLRILNMIITMKKWIKNAHPGWQPITVTLLETKDDDIGNDS